MDTELETLEAKVEQVVALVHQLRAENRSLRQQIATVESERLQLRQNMSAARERLEGLLEKLPEEV